MPLTETQKKLLVAGGLITIGGVTAYAVAKALAKPEVPPPPEEVPPPTYPPATIEFLNLPITIEQYYHSKLSGWFPFSQHLDDIIPYVNPECTEQGWVVKIIRGRVSDAMGRGIPGIVVNVWSSPTPDMHNGSLNLMWATRTVDAPLRLVTGYNGEFTFSVEYLTAQSYLAEKGCRACTPIGCQPAKPCLTIYPIYGTRFTCGYKTPGAVYQLTAKVEGTVLSTIGVVTAYANLVG